MARTTRFAIPFLWSFALIGALLYAPAAATAECKITCKKCVIDLGEGTAECTDCTIEGCEMKPGGD